MGGTDYAKEGIVHIENLVKRYGSLVALDHLNLDIREGRDLWSSGTKRFRKNNSNQLYAGSLKI